MVCNGGVYLFTLMDWHTASWAILLLGIAEVIFNDKIQKNLLISLQLFFHSIETENQKTFPMGYFNDRNLIGDIICHWMSTESSLIFK